MARSCSTSATWMPWSINGRNNDEAAGMKTIAAKRNAEGGYTPKRNGVRVRRYPLPQFSTQKPLFRAGGVIVEGRRMDETENFTPLQKEQSMGAPERRQDRPHKHHKRRVAPTPVGDLLWMEKRSRRSPCIINLMNERRAVSKDPRGFLSKTRGLPAPPRRCEGYSVPSPGRRRSGAQAEIDVGIHWLLEEHRVKRAPVG